MADLSRKIKPSSGMSKRVDTSTPQIGIVKQNNDTELMGRLKVWIRGSTSPEGENNPENWITCSYASPFAGASDPSFLSNNAQDPTGSQESYGLWAVPPDLNNQVIVIFVNGDIKQACWIACLYQKNMNHMVPGIAGSNSYQSGQYSNSAVPVTEYNKLGNSSNIRPVFRALASGIQLQGLLSDPLRGAGTSSARRESPSDVYGWKTPSGQHFVMDDEETNEFIRLRTKSGTQILISETVGNIYFISKNGKNWAELNNDGNIDFYSSTAFNVYSRGDINFRANGNINLEAGGDVNYKSSKSINFETSQDFNIKAAGNTAMQSGGSFNVTSDAINMLSTGNNLSISTGDGTSGFVMTPAGDMNFGMAGNLNMSIQGNMTEQVHGNRTFWQGPGGTVQTDSLPHGSSINNVTPAAPVPPITPVKPPNVQLYQQIVKDNNNQTVSMQSACTRIPDAEPWDGHAAAITGIRHQVQESEELLASKGSVTSNAAQPLPVVGSPNKGMTPGVYIPAGYTTKGEPIYDFSGSTAELLSVNKLVTSQAGIAFISRQEGFSETKYRDASGFSIGYGHFIVPSDPLDVQNGPISVERALQLLAVDVKKAEDAIRKNVKVTLTQSQFDALVDFIYNVGTGAFANSTLLKKLNEGNYSEVPTQLARWIYSQKKIIPALIRRRREEAQLFVRLVETI